MPRRDGEHFLASITHRADGDQQSGLLTLEPYLHVDAIGPGVYEFAVVEPQPAPGVVLDLPLRFEPLGGRRRQRRAIAEQTSQGELKVAVRETVQVQLRQPGSRPSPEAHRTIFTDAPRRSAAAHEAEVGSVSAARRRRAPRSR